MLDQTRIRLDAITHVLALRERWVAVPASELVRFVSGDLQVFLKGAQGIFKPKELDEPLSILSTLNSPYTDTIFGTDGRKILYAFANPTHEADNDGLKRCAEYQLPLIYLLQVKAKPNPEYEIFAPVYVVAWDDSTRQFLVDLSGQPSDQEPASVGFARQLNLPEVPLPSSEMEVREIAKGYLLTTVQRRIHQARFRAEVLKVYRERCAVCVLGIRPLLDAAHVIPDVDPKPTIIINEGLALCATHHRAFDARILRYDSSFRIRVELPNDFRAGEGEQSMLLAFDGRPLTLPREQTFWPIAT